MQFSPIPEGNDHSTITTTVSEAHQLEKADERPAASETYGEEKAVDLKNN